MKRSVLVLLVFITLSVTVNAQQEPFLQWQRSLGGSGDDEAYSIDTTTDGGYIIAGASTSTNDDVSGNHGDYDYWIVKLDASHNTEWAKTYGGSGLDIAKSIKQTKDGGFIIAGYSNSKDGDVTGNHGGIDMWILKLDAGGNIIWQKSLGGSYYDYAYSVEQTTDSGYIIAGTSASKDGDVTNNSGNYDYWIVKLNADGNLQWQKTYGGKSGDYAYSVQQTNDGGYILGGTSHSNDNDIHNNHGGNDYCILKLDTIGNLQWQNCYGGTGQELFTDIQQTKDSGYIMSGSTQSSDGQVTGYHNSSYHYADAWIVKINSTGKIIWKKAIGNEGYEVANSIKQTAAGGYIFTGYNTQNGGKISGNRGQSDLWIVQLDTAGNIQWQKSFGGYSSETGYSIQLAADGGYVAAGASDLADGNVSYNYGGDDYWVLKLSPQNLPHNIAVTDYDTMATCSLNNYITYQVKEDLPVSVNLYRFGILYKTRDSIKEYVTFNNLKPGQYYATITSGNTLLGTSKIINIAQHPVNFRLTDIESESAFTEWKLVPCADSYSVEYKEIDSVNWKVGQSGILRSYYFQHLTPSTTYLLRLGTSIIENGIAATGKRYDSLTFTTLAASGDAAIAEKLNVLSNNITILPNPASSYFIINYSSTINKKASAVLYDVNGKAVWTSGLVNTEAFISKKVITSQLPNGVYYLKLMDDAGTSINTKKIIIAR